MRNQLQEGFFSISAACSQLHTRQVPYPDIAPLDPAPALFRRLRQYFPARRQLLSEFVETAFGIRTALPGCAAGGVSDAEIPGRFDDLAHLFDQIVGGLGLSRRHFQETQDVQIAAAVQERASGVLTATRILHGVGRGAVAVEFQHLLGSAADLLEQVFDRRALDQLKGRTFADPAEQTHQMIRTDGDTGFHGHSGSNGFRKDQFPVILR
ncbi:hypothetical protein SDC9_119684 [bioreactor metagenome]|uniref:Uncharacterized protein n=1 Tax=bioreactor metagenome TaxID=1076179 RepID=A0A645C5S0_9ZZZZ